MKRTLWILGILCALAFSGCKMLKNFGPTLTPYTCESGKTIEVKNPSPQTVFLYYDGRRHRLSIEDYGEADVYLGKRYEWRTEGTGPGSTGILYRVKDNGAVEDAPIERCTEDD